MQKKINLLNPEDFKLEWAYIIQNNAGTALIYLQTDFKDITQGCSHRTDSFTSGKQLFYRLFGKGVKWEKFPTRPQVVTHIPIRANANIPIEEYKWVINWCKAQNIDPWKKGNYKKGTEAYHLNKVK